MIMKKFNNIFDTNLSTLILYRIMQINHYYEDIFDINIIFVNWKFIVIDSYKQRIRIYGI